MATIHGDIRGLVCMSTPWSGIGARESWFMTVDFGAYDSSADTMDIATVGAAIDAQARDGKASTLLGAVCVFPGRDTNDQAVYAAGLSVQALAVSTDTLTGILADVAGTEYVGDATACKGVGILVIVTRA